MPSAPVILNPLQEPAWDARVAVHPDAGFFHSTAWVRVLHETYGYAPCFGAVKAGERLEGVLPLMEVNSWLTGRRAVGLPFTDACPPLVSEPAGFQRLFQQAREFGTARGWKYLELRGGRGLLPSSPPSASYYVHELNLSEGEAKLAAGCKDSVRRAIRRAEKLGVTISLHTELPALREFYGLQCRTRRKHGLPPQPFRFFLKLQEHILSKQNGLLVLARHGGRAVAGAVFFQFGEEAIFKYGASDAAHQGLRGNDLVMWEAIKHYARHGFRRLNLGRTSLGNAGLRRFKLAWGATERPAEYVRYDFRQQAFVSGRDEAFGWYNSLFRWLPLGVSRWAGSLAYRHVA